MWDPVAPFLKGTETVFIVPDGTLSLVPFVALPVDSTAYLIERAPMIHYLPAERDLVSLPGDAERWATVCWPWGDRTSMTARYWGCRDDA